VRLPQLIALFALYAGQQVCAQAPLPGPTDNQSLKLWQDVKQMLLGPDGMDYFIYNLKDAVVPGGTAGLHTIVGTVLSSRPQNSPGELVLAISDANTPEVTLRFFDAHHAAVSLKRSIAPATMVAFEGTPTAFSRDPFMLTVEVELGGAGYGYFHILGERREDRSKSK
jgi:hypothetical protein